MGGDVVPVTVRGGARTSRSAGSMHTAESGRGARVKSAASPSHVPERDPPARSVLIASCVRCRLLKRRSCTAPESSMNTWSAASPSA